MNNTPVADMLGLPDSDVEQTDGDALGSFWTPTKAALERDREVGEAAWSGRAPDGQPQPESTEWAPPAYVRRNVRREAYSWGAQARYAGSLGSSRNKWALRFSRAGWLLLAPLGLTNAAYWSRRLAPDRLVARPSRARAGRQDTEGEHLSGETTSRRDASGRARGRGGSVFLDDDGCTVERHYARGQTWILWFGLGLTLMFVSTLLAAALDMIATQCMGSVVDGRSTTCPALPSWLGTVSSQPWTHRLVILSVVPVSGLFLLQWLSSSARMRYETVTPSAHVDHADVGLAAVPVLSQHHLWQRWVLTERTAHLHLAAGLGLVGATLSWTGMWSESARCDRVSRLFDGQCHVVASRQVWYAVLTALTMAVVVVAGVMLAFRPLGGRRRHDAISSVVSAGALLVATALTLWRDDRVSPERVPGLSFVPAALLTSMLLVALVAATWRKQAWRTAAALCGALIVLGALVSATRASRADDARPVLIALAGFVVIGGAGLAERRSARLSDAWRGTAPAVFLLLALGLQALLCSTMLVALGDWLNGKQSAASLILPSAYGSHSTAAKAAERADLHLATVYAAFAAFAAMVLLIVVVVMLGLRLRWSWSGRRKDEGGVAGKAADVRAATRAKWMNIRQRAGTYAELSQWESLRSAVLRQRDLADLLQRTESLAGGLALGLGGALAATVFVLPGRGWAADHLAAAVPRVATVGLWLIVAVWVLGVAKLLTADTGGRPAGLLWDLLCFLPRTAHPFGPPCYAERAVPEIAARIDSWLCGTDLPASSRPALNRRVVLAPHSMGVVLAISALMLENGRQERRGKVALLTYGTQLRPYFGRFFPELLGPSSIGYPPVRCAQFSTPTWDAPSVEQSADLTQTFAHQSLIDRLTMKPLRGTGQPVLLWINLWRPTDPLGMQIGVPGADWVAEEIDAAGYLAAVATHGGYPRSIAYRAAFDELVTRFAEVADPSGTPARRQSPDRSRIRVTVAVEGDG